MLILIGAFWSLSRIFNQPKMFSIVKDKIKTGGFFYGLWCYFRGEIFGLGLGIGLVIIGIFIYNN